MSEGKNQFVRVVLGALKCPSTCLNERFEFCDQLPEFVWAERLRPIGQCVFRIRMHFDHQSVRPCGDRSLCHWIDIFPMPCPVARIGDDRQVTHLLDYRNCIQVKGVPRRRFKGTDAPLAQDDVVIPFGEDIAAHACRVRPQSLR